MRLLPSEVDLVGAEIELVALERRESRLKTGLEPVMGYYALLDRAPLGRNEGDPPEVWFRRHDEYNESRRQPAHNR